MTWSRFTELVKGWELEPPPEHLLTLIAAAHGYKPPEPPKSGEEAAQELMRLFPGGSIRGPQG